METEEMKTKIVEDDEALNDEPLNTENSQVSEITVEETESDEVCVFLICHEEIAQIN